MYINNKRRWVPASTFYRIFCLQNEKKYFTIRQKRCKILIERETQKNNRKKAERGWQDESITDLRI